MLATRRRKLLSAVAADVSGAAPGAGVQFGKLESSFLTVARSGDTLTTRLLERLASSYPGVRNAIPPGAAPATPELLDAIALILAHRRNPDAAREQLHALGRRHAEQGLRAPHYRLICELLVRSIAELCAADWDAELECEWTSSLNLGAATMIEGAAVTRPS